MMSYAFLIAHFSIIMTHLFRILRATVFIGVLSFLPLSHIRAQSHDTPVFFGFDIGTSLTSWQHGTPTYFATNYPFPPGSDTIHVPFSSGEKPLFGFYAALTELFYLDRHWSIETKFGYDEWRGEWSSTEGESFDTNGVAGTVPVSSDLVFLVRTMALMGTAEYHFSGLKGLYLGAGLGVRALITNHYDLDRSLQGGPPGLSFSDLSTGQGTGNRSYGIGGDQPISSAVADATLLAGYSVELNSKWYIEPQITLDLPLLSIWTSDKKSEYAASGFGNPPEPLAFTGILAIRYRLQ